MRSQLFRKPKRNEQDGDYEMDPILLPYIFYFRE
jgi:hypothetical protein